MRLDPKLCRAHRILSGIKLPRDLEESCIIRNYTNGREEGLTVLLWHRMPKNAQGKYMQNCPQVSFSECRASDGIVVYLGRSKDFDPYGGPSDEVHADRLYISRGSFREDEKFASKAITKFFLKAMKRRA